MAAGRGHLGVVGALLADHRVVDPNQGGVGGFTPLVIAASKGQADVVAALLRDQRVKEIPGWARDLGTRGIYRSKHAERGCVLREARAQNARTI